MRDLEKFQSLAIQTSLASPSRRGLLAQASGLGLGVALGAGLWLPAGAVEPAPSASPKKGGTLRIGMEGGSASDSLDPRTYSDSIPITAALTLMNGLVEIGADGQPKGELLESWEAKPGAAVWIFNVRQGISFTSGKKLDADDILYSLSLHMGETKSPAKSLLKQIKEMKKISPYKIEITLNSGNIEFPAVLTAYHLVVVPKGFSDWSKPDGTGAFSLVKFEPGVRIAFKSKGDYWKPERANFDAVEILYINDKSARISALKSGKIDAANRIDPRTVGLLARDQKINIVRSKGAGYRLCFDANVAAAPFNNKDLRLALKYGIDRKKIIDTVYKGYATIGNDNPIDSNYTHYNEKLAQRPYDPDKAAFHLKKSGLGNQAIVLEASEGAWDSAVDCASLFQESLAKAGVNLNVKKVAADGYWENTWMKQPFCAAYWSRRPTVDIMLSQMLESNSSWNDTHWKNEEFDKLLVSARIEFDEEKRKEMYARCQELVSDDGGMICFAVADHLDAYSKKVMGNAPHPRFDLADYRIAEKGWFA